MFNFFSKSFSKTSSFFITLQTPINIYIYIYIYKRIRWLRKWYLNYDFLNKRQQAMLLIYKALDLNTTKKKSQL